MIWIGDSSSIFSYVLFGQIEEKEGSSNLVLVLVRLLGSHFWERNNGLLPKINKFCWWSPVIHLETSREIFETLLITIKGDVPGPG